MEEEEEEKNKKINSPVIRKRANKPLMEKRRRARINRSLADLRNLIMDYLKKERSRTSKLEKADILETTLRYARDLQRLQRAIDVVTDPNVSNKFQAGYNECIREVRQHLSSGTEELEPNAMQRLLSHITEMKETSDFQVTTTRDDDVILVENPQEEEHSIKYSFGNVSSSSSSEVFRGSVAKICGIRIATDGQVVLVVRDFGSLEDETSSTVSQEQTRPRSCEPSSSADLSSQQHQIAGSEVTDVCPSLLLPIGQPLIPPDEFMWRPW